MTKLKLLPWIAVCLCGSVAWAGADSEATSAQPTFVTNNSWSVDSTLSWQTLGQTGSLQRYYKYAVPAKGFFLSDLNVLGTTPQGFNVARFHGFDLGEDDQGLGLVLNGTGANSPSARWEYNRFLFFADPGTGPAVGSKRNNNDVAVILPVPGLGTSLHIGYLFHQLEEPTIKRLGTTGIGFDNKELNLNMAVPVPVIGGNLGLAYTNGHFVDNTNYLPQTDSDIYRVEYSLERSERTTLNAFWTRTAIKQIGLPAASRTEQWQVSGLYRPSPKWNASGTIGERFIDQPMTANAYTRRTNTADVHVNFRVNHKTTAQAGYTRLDFERIDRDHTFVQTPRRETFWARARARLPKGLLFTGKLSIEDVKGIPPSEIVYSAPGSTADADPIYPNKRDQYELRLSGSVNDNTWAYLFYNGDKVRNDPRVLTYTVNTFGVGAYTQLSSRWSFDIDYERTKWNDKGSPAFNDPVSFYLLNNRLPYMADDQSVTLSTSFTVNPVTTISGNYTRYRGENGALSNDREYGLSLNRALKHDLSFVIAWQRSFHNDNDPSISPYDGLDFGSNVWRVDLKGRF